MVKMICGTKQLKEKGIFNRSRFYFHSKHNVDPRAARLFSGVIHLIQINFGSASVSMTDLQTALKHATLSSQIISKYCSQYGPNKIDVDQNIISFNAPTNSFSDAQLQSWIDTIAQTNNWPHNDGIIILSPTNANNTDAPVSQGILGYHGMANLAYSFINALGNGLTLDDRADLYATALSHEIAEMCVDPAADLSNPEVCDSCAGNCGVNYLNCFDMNGNYLGGNNSPGYAFFIDGIATPVEVNRCPASVSACIYAPDSNSPAPSPAPTPNPTPNPCLDQIHKGVTELEAGNIILGIDDIIGGIVCYFEHGFLKQTKKKELRKKLL